MTAQRRNNESETNSCRSGGNALCLRGAHRGRQAGSGAAAAHRQRGICAGSTARALPERGQRPVPAPPEHPLAAGHQNGIFGVHPPCAGHPPLHPAGPCGHGDPDRHRLQPACLPRLHRAGARRGFLLQRVGSAGKGLIEEAGRLDLPGRPVAFRTTDVFLRCFGLSSLEDLPPVRGTESEAAQ